MALIMAVQHLRATNDPNGNPRRCYLMYGIDGQVVAVHDEEYAGRPEILRKGLAPELPEMTITVSEYRAWLKVGERLRDLGVTTTTKENT